MKQLLLLFCCLACSLHAANLLLDPATGEVRKANIASNTTVERKSDKVSIAVNGFGQNLSYSLPLSPESKYLLLRMKIRATDLVPDKEGWQNGRMAMRFYDKEGKPAGAWPDVFSASGTTDFRECERIYKIPEGAVRLQLNPANFGKSGKIEFDEVYLEELKDFSGINRDYTLPAELNAQALSTLSDAWRATTPTRERISLNGLWQFRPELPGDEPGKIPAAGTGWGYFKVPGAWPVSRNGMEFYLSALVKAELDYAKLNNGFYRREIEIPANWNNRRILLNADMIQTCAKIYVDGTEAGEFYYPGGEADLTGKLLPGKKHTLVLLVSANPGEGLVFMAPGRLVKTEGGLQNRGITGDLYLESRPEKAAVGDVLVVSSVKDGTIRFDTGFANLPAGNYKLEAEVLENGKRVKRFQSAAFKPEGNDFRFTFGGDWKDAKLWDTDTPENLYTVKVRLSDANGKLLDEFLEEEFGFREFKTDGRFFYLNGRKIHLRALVTRTPQMPLFASEPWIEHLVKESRQFGANFLIGWNYNFQPGIFCYIDSFHRGTSKRGMLTSLTLPHVRDFQLKMKDPETAAAYRRQAEHLIRRVQNIPGLIMHVMNHNATGYMGDQNPERLGTGYKPEDATPPETLGTRRNAEIAEGIAKQLDPTRPVYHHESGNLGDVFTLNCYLNWAPRQERSDWLETWEEKGKMPVFFVEWGIPHVASWSSWRGPAFIWRSAGLQCLWVNEFNAAILGENAYRSEPAKNRLYDHQEKLIKGNREVFFSQLGGNNILNNVTDVHAVRKYFASRNFRDMRARGISGLLPWDQFLCWQWISNGEGDRENPNRFDNLKQPGVIPDMLLNTGEAICNPIATYTYTLTGEGVQPNFQECIGWIGGKPGEITEAGHNFRAGETVRKTLVLLNHSRRDQTVKWSWIVPALKLDRNGESMVPAGERLDIPLEFELPAAVPSALKIEAKIEFPGQPAITDSFPLDVLPRKTLELKAKTGLYDPEGSAAPLLKRIGVSAKQVKSEADLAGVELLVIGRNALPGIPIKLEKYLQNGLKVMILEQPAEELFRLGLRYTEQGYREVFFAGNPAFSDLRDWRGHATQLPPMLTVAAYESHNPKWNWNGFDNTRVWRAGNRGSITEVLIEKPAIGDWLPLLQCGFDLQYAPLLLFSEGKGMILFCQLAVSGRSEAEPEAENIFAEALGYLDRAAAVKKRSVLYLGNADGAEYLMQLKIPFRHYTPETKLNENTLLVLGSGAKPGNLAAALESGTNILALGLTQNELEETLPGTFQMETGRFFSDLIPGLGERPEFAGIGNSELHWRGGMTFDAFPVNAAGGRSLALHKAGKGTFAAYQLPPWKFDREEFYYRTTRRRAAFLGSRLLANLGAEYQTHFFAFFGSSVGNSRFTLPNDQWTGMADPKNEGRGKGFFKPEFRPGEEWRRILVPGYFDDQFKELADYGGYFWYRLEFDVPEAFCNSPAELFIGAVDDESWTWLNGQFLGEVTKLTNPKDYWAFPRRYNLAPGSLKPGRNVIMLLCNDTFNKGGIMGIPQIKFQTEYSSYTDDAKAEDDPYRYYRW